jgi:hypothetical protein
LLISPVTQHQTYPNAGFVKSVNPKEKSRLASTPWVLQSANYTAVFKAWS